MAVSAHRVRGFAFFGLLGMGSLVNAVPLQGANAAAQDDCAANFKVGGDPRNGASYSAFVTIPNLDMRSSLGQIEAMAIKEKFKIGAETYSENEGQLTFVQEDKNTLFKRSPGFPIFVNANRQTNQLSMKVRINRGQTIDDATMRGYLCGMLTKVTMDGKGAALAAEARAKTHNGSIIDVKAEELSWEVQKAMFGHSDNPSLVEAQYVGRVYRVDGQVLAHANTTNIAVDHLNGIHSFNMSFYLQKPKGIESLLNGASEAMKVGVECRTAADQEQRFLALRDRDYATLVGTVTKLVWSTTDVMKPITSSPGESGTLYLDCRFEDGKNADAPASSDD